jgi:hypothetical protein
MTDNTNKLICQAVACVITVYVLWLFLPYIVLFLAVCGAWYLYQEHNRNNRGGGCGGNKGGKCR